MPANKQITDTMQLIVTNLSHRATGHQIQSRIFASQGFSKLEAKHADHAEEDYQSYEILRDYYVNEDEDANWFESQLELTEKIGEQNWYMLQL